MRISDWSSDVCSSDLPVHLRAQHPQADRDRRPEQHEYRQRADPADETIRPEDGDISVRKDHRIAEVALGHVAQHQRQHQRRQRIVELLEGIADDDEYRSEEHTSELQSLMLISYAVFCLKNKTKQHNNNKITT